MFDKMRKESNRRWVLLFGSSISFVILFCSVAYCAEVEFLHTTIYVRYNEKNRRFFKDAKDSPIKLYAARNETISFQLVVRGGKKLGNRLSFNFSDFSGPSMFDIRNFALFSLENCQEGFLQDCLVPFANDIDINELALGLDFKVIWADLHIPNSQLSGSYSGRLKIVSGRKLIEDIRIELCVYPFKLPVKPSLKVDLNNYGVNFVKRWKIEPGTETAYRIERAFYRLAHRHRMIFNPLPYKSQRGTPHMTMAPQLETRGDNVMIKNWYEFDKRYGPLFDGTAFDDGIPIDHQYLPFNPEWPSAFSNYLTRRNVYEKQWAHVAREFKKHFKEKGWSQTVFQIYLNQKPNNNNRIPWNLDEPKGNADYGALRYYADLVHSVFPETNSLKFKFRIDISHFYCDKHRGNHQKDFRINNGEEMLKPVDIWVISKHSLDSTFAQKQAGKLKAKGKTIYEYFSGTSMPLITDPLVSGIKFGWRAWLRREDGILFWNTVKFNDKPTDGRDFLIYPGYDMNVDGPIASLRLKAIRRGVQDFEYFMLVESKEAIQPLIESYLSADASGYLKCRQLIANWIIYETGRLKK